ncbi:MAG: signal peptidase I [Planctomycetes bacterium]|nr:signal peptidase I [Planctomycetota bacterium]
MAARDQKPKSPHPLRDNVDAFAIAILVAVLMKYFAIEAYEIPTSSMQPTMMGSKETGLFDRILVDKSAYLWRDPERFEIAVFRYPGRLIQNYVKRIVGLPGERLVIAGGNVYRLDGDDPTDGARMTPLPRPPAIQEEHWKEVFPARLASWNLPANSGWRRSDRWEAIDGRADAFRIEHDKERTAWLSFRDDGKGGLVNHVSDGYPTWVAQAMIKAREDVEWSEVVQDARLRFTLRSTAPLAGWSVELEVVDADGTKVTFRLSADGTSARLGAERDGQSIQSEPFAVPATTAGLAVQFAHVDDHLHVELDGEPGAELDTGAFKSLDLRRFAAAGTPGASKATAGLRIEVKGQGRIEVEDLRVDRDLHYVRDGATAIVDVPAGKYWMLGDNTLQSVDSRGWTVFTIGVDAEARVVDPRTHPDATPLRGNLRPMPLSEMPDPDENPVPARLGGVDYIGFTDEIGEVYALLGAPAPGASWGGGALAFAGADGPFVPRQDAIPFVPRDHILGRPLLTFWPWYPWFRAGTIR